MLVQAEISIESVEIINNLFMNILSSLKMNWVFEIYISEKFR